MAPEKSSTSFAIAKIGYVYYIFPNTGPNTKQKTSNRPP
jgi:hypothetical protein